MPHLESLAASNSAEDSVSGAIPSAKIWHVAKARKWCDEEALDFLRCGNGHTNCSSKSEIYREIARRMLMHKVMIGLILGWILWFQQYNPWTVISVYSDQTQCLYGLAARLAALQQQGDTIRIEGNTGHIHHVSTQESGSAMCLPDTVTPNGR
jgi:hypothetical protein